MGRPDRGLRAGRESRGTGQGLGGAAAVHLVVSTGLWASPWWLCVTPEGIRGREGSWGGHSSVAGGPRKEGSDFNSSTMGQG